MDTELIQRQLKYNFTDNELLEKSEQLAGACTRLKEIEDEKKEVMSEYKHKVDEQSARISVLSCAIERKGETRMIDCEVEYNYPNKGVKTLTRMDNLEKIQEQMNHEDMQREMKLDEE